MEGGAGTGPGPGEQLATRGHVDPSLREEFPGLYLRYLEVAAGSARSPKPLRRRLATLSDRFAGAQAITFRTKPIPGAYRIFYRHIGLDPDEQPGPAEAAVLERMLKGGFISRSSLDDALTIAMIESGVPVHALDADRLTGTLAIRPTVAGEVLEGRPGELPVGTLVIADERRPVSLLFGAVGSGRGVSPATVRTTLLVVGVSGVPEIAVEEALWLATEALLGN
jgi:DNA/RNA-binding domain of Phe-tRNA-synthetase-like protein